MKRIALLSLLLTITTACGGSDGSNRPPNPPPLDIRHLGVACPAPEVPITLEPLPGHIPPPRDGYPQAKPAGELVVGEEVWSTYVDINPLAGAAQAYAQVSGVVVIPNQPRKRLVLTDGRTPIFTPDHAVYVDPRCSTVLLPAVFADGENQPGGWVELRYVEPGWCLYGTVPGVVARLEDAPDGDIVRLSVGREATTTEGGYFADGLLSMGHNVNM